MGDGSENRRNIFRNGGTQPTSQELTKAWIALIDRLERSKAALAEVQEGSVSRAWDEDGT